METPGHFSKALLNLKNYYSTQFNEMMGELYIQVEMPEPPKVSFFKGLFGGGSQSLDREELCKFFVGKIYPVIF